MAPFDPFRIAIKEPPNKGIPQLSNKKKLGNNISGVSLLLKPLLIWGVMCAGNGVADAGLGNGNPWTVGVINFKLKRPSCLLVRLIFGTPKAQIFFGEPQSPEFFGEGVAY